MDQNGPFWSREYQNPVRNKVILTKMVALTILDHFGPVHFPTVLRRLLRNLQFRGAISTGYFFLGIFSSGSFAPVSPACLYTKHSQESRKNLETAAEIPADKPWTERLANGAFEASAKTGLKKAHTKISACASLCCKNMCCASRFCTGGGGAAGSRSKQCPRARKAKR